MTVDHQRSVPDSGNAKVLIYTWPSLAAGEEGQAVQFPQCADRTIQFDGTFDGASVALIGSIDGSTWFSLTDPQGNAISKAGGALEAVTEVTLYVKPVVAGGGVSTAINARLLMRTA